MEADAGKIRDSEAYLLRVRDRRGYPKQAIVAVGAVVFRDERVLLVRRGQAPSRDQWAIPGGRIELGETLQQAAEREIYEETGVRIRAGKPLHTFDVVERDGEGRVRFHYVIVDLAAEYIEGEARAGDDASEACWISAAELKTLSVSTATRCLLRRHFGFGA